MLVKHKDLYSDDYWWDIYNVQSYLPDERKPRYHDSSEQVQNIKNNAIPKY